MNVEVIDFTANVGTTSAKGRITKRTKELLVIMETSDSAVGSDGLLLPSLTERITASVASKSGEIQTSIPNTALGNLVFAAQFKEGAAEINTGGSAVDGTYKAVGRYIVDMTMSNGIELDSDQDLELTIAGCRPGMRYRIIPLGTEVSGNVLIKYSNRTINQGTTNQEVPLANVVAAVLPDLPALESIQVMYTNGSSEVHTRETLAAKNQKENDTALIVDGKIITASNVGFLYLNCLGVHKVIMYTSGDVYHFTTLQLVTRG